LEKGGDLYCDYSAKYNNSSVNAIGLATAVDSLAAIKKAVFEDKIMTLDEFKEILKSNAEWLTENESANVTIEGHCDERGTAEYNMALSAKRANAVLDYMKSLGIAASRMTTAPYGEELPLDPGHDEAAWSKNRRAHFDVK
jgi:peptidoglycan-associated lipoprotein